MPVVKHASVAISREELAELRQQLAESHQFQLIERHGTRMLFVRSSRAEPDPVSDLENTLEHLPDAALRDLDHIVLLGSDGDLHLPGATLAPLIERRRLLDRLAVTHWRATLPTEYGVGIHRVAGDPAQLVRLGVRIPRARCVDLNEVDLLRMAETLGPTIDAGEAPEVSCAYLVSDDDHVRLLASDFFADLAPRWEHTKTQRLAPPPPPPEPEPAFEASGPDPSAAAPKRRRPSRTIRVRPALELTSTIDATPPEIEHDPTLIDAAVATLSARLADAHFDVMSQVAHGGHTFALAAERGVGYPSRILVRTVGRFSKKEALDAQIVVRELEADLIVVVAAAIDDDAARRTLATKVKAVLPSEIGQLRF